MSWKAFLIAFLMPAIVLAQTPIRTLPTGEDKIVVLPKGKEAPYDGQLFDNATALRWANWLQQYKLRLSEDVKMEIELCKVRMDYKDKVLEIEKDRGKTIELDLRTRLRRSEETRLLAEEAYRNPPWYNGRTFGVVVGVVATSVIFGR